MAKTANINLRIEPSKKEQAEALFGKFGISVTDALNIFINTAIMEGGFPFPIKQPRYNIETELAMREAREIMEGKISTKKYANFSDLMNDIDKD